MELIAQRITAACYGMSLTSERLLKGEISYGMFMPAWATSVHPFYEELSPREPLKHHITVQAATQVSSEIFRHLLEQADLISVADSSTFRDNAYDMIKADSRCWKLSSYYDETRIIRRRTCCSSPMI